MKLVVIIPALNEAKTVAAIVHGIPPAIPRVDKIEIVVIDDGSTDETARLATTAGAAVISHPTNRGVGAAFQTGLTEALKRGADLVVNIDADGQFNPADIAALLAPVTRGTADFASATRFARPEQVPIMPSIKRLGNTGMTALINFITRKKFTDVACGFRAYSREAALRLTLFGKFTYTQESLIDLSFKGIAMAEVPLTIRGVREHGRSRVADNLWRYGLKAATIIFRAARDYRPHYFFGIPGLIVLALGLASGVFLLQHYVTTGQTAPYRSLVSITGVFIIVGGLLLFLSLLADMLHRNRMIIEEAVYHLRKQSYGN